jgi:hypothetical protein
LSQVKAGKKGRFVRIRAIFGHRGFTPNGKNHHLITAILYSIKGAEGGSSRDRTSDTRIFNPLHKPRIPLFINVSFSGIGYFSGYSCIIRAIRAPFDPWQGSQKSK